MSNYIILSLQECLENGIDMKLINAGIQKFYCKKNTDIESFIKTKSIDFEKNNMCRTYLVLDEDILTESGQFSIIGFFSITTTTLQISSFTNTARRRLFGRFYPKKQNYVPIFLIGQLGRNDIYSSVHMPGETLLDEAINIIHKAKRYIGGQLVLLECQPKSKLIKVYENYGFAEVNRNEDGTLTRMILKID